MSGNGASDGVGTEWSGYTVSNIWAMVKDETHEHGYAQVAVWQRISDLCTKHADTIEKTITQLKESWPATPGSAAELFQRNLAGLAGSLRDTARVATNNARELQGVTEHIIYVQQCIAPLAQERLPVNSTPMPQGGTVRGDQLNVEAQQVMRTTEPTAAASAQRLQSPRAFNPRPIDFDSPPPDESDPKPTGAGSGLPQGSYGGATDPLRPSWSTETTYPAEIASAGPHLAGRTVPGTPDMPTGHDIPGAGTGGGSGAASPTYDGYGSPAIPGRVIRHTSDRPAVDAAAPYVYSGSAGRAPGSGAQGHGAGGFVGGMPMAMGGGRPAATPDGLRVGRPGGVIDGARRRPPHDPDDPWAIDPEVVEPVIGGFRTTDADGDDHGPPPGVVEIRGWPR
ncbi:hypothetical protein GCM10009682_32880 [Luedemannella flava]|uniref:PPE family domain-containing protein n=1 Tax=Luedemannella flava TaxID=349316 RepID=A0ABP4YA20_9ACTN